MPRAARRKGAKSRVGPMRCGGTCAESPRAREEGTGGLDLVEPVLEGVEAVGPTEEVLHQIGGDGVEAYWEDLRAASPKRFKNNRRLESKLDREVGELRLVAPDGELSTFETLIDWKRASNENS